MAENVKTGWLHNSDGEKISPNTLVGQVFTTDGQVFAETLASVAFTGSYNDLTDKPPTTGDDGTVSVSVDGALSATSENPVQNKVIYSALQGKANKSEIPTVPQNVSAFNNDAKYVTETALNGKGYLTSIPSEYVTESELNGKGYLTSIPSEYVTETELNGKGYLTEHQSLDGYATESYVTNAVDNAGYLTSVPSEYVTETELNNKGYLTSVPSEYVTETELNNKGYLSSVPSEYVTESELEDKGYLTEHQSLSGYATESYVNSSLNGKADNRIAVKLVPDGTKIEAMEDLNDIKFLSVGNFYCNNSNVAMSLSNCPTDQAFGLDVYSPISSIIDNEGVSTWVYRVQKIKTFLADEYIRYVMSGSDASSFTYGTWKKLATSSDLSRKVDASSLGNISSINKPTSNQTTTYLRGDGTWVTPPNNITTATTSGSGNAVTAITASNGKLTVTKGATFLTSHQSLSNRARMYRQTWGTSLTIPDTNCTGILVGNTSALWIIARTGSEAINIKAVYGGSNWPITPNINGSNNVLSWTGNGTLIYIGI